MRSKELYAVRAAIAEALELFTIAPYGHQNPYQRAVDRKLLEKVADLIDRDLAGKPELFVPVALEGLYMREGDELPADTRCVLQTEAMIKATREAREKADAEGKACAFCLKVQPHAQFLSARKPVAKWCLTCRAALNKARKRSRAEERDRVRAADLLRFAHAAREAAIEAGE